MQSESDAPEQSMPGADGLQRTRAPSRASANHLAQAVLLAVIAGFLLTVIPGVRPSPGYSFWLDGVWQCAAFFAASIICTLRIAGHRSQRAFWYCINAALYCDATGETLWSWFVGQSAAGSASVADLAWLGYYLLILAGLAVLMRSQLAGLKTTVIADAAVVGFGAVAIGSAAIAPFIVLSAGGVVENLVSIGYPILDLAFMVAVLCVITIYRWQPPSGLWMVFAALTVWTVADLLFVVEVAGHDYVSGGVGDAMYVVAATITALAPGGRRRAAHGIPQWLPMVMPVMAGTAAVLVLFLQGRLGGGEISRWTALAAVTAAGARLSLVYSEGRRTAELGRLANTDDLTGLLNRRGFFAAHQELMRPRPNAHAVLLLDFDRFKDINDSLGHHAGDELLRAAAGRIADIAPEGSHIARFGGDEFVVAVRVLRRADAEAVANALVERLTEPFDLAGLDVMVGVSIGIAMCPLHGADTTTLLRHADFAMFGSKRNGSGQAFYAFDVPTPESISSGRSGLELLAQFRTAIEERSLDIHYQPIHDVVSGSVVGAEALLRWRHPRHGLLGPALLLPLAIRHALMPKLTHAVFDIALGQARRWRDAGHKISVSVNVSPSVLAHEDLAVSILESARRAGVPPSSLVVEITEDHFVGDYRRTRAILDDLRAHGVRISLDDFGQGHSILEYLRELTIDEVKLDRSFIHELTSDARTAAIVAAIVALAHTLGVRVVAEGVETAEGDDELRIYECDFAQGNYYSPPLSAVEIGEYLTTCSQLR